MGGFRGHPWRICLHAFQTLAFGHYLFNYQYSFGWGYGPSMLPTFLVDGDIIIFDRHHRRGRDVRVGDCVAYHIPVSPDEDGVKRVIGMPGDYILMNSPGASSDRMLQVSSQFLRRPLRSFVAVAVYFYYVQKALLRTFTNCARLDRCQRATAISWGTICRGREIAAILDLCPWLS